MVIMGGWVFYMVEEHVYVVEVICEYECIRWEHFGVLHGDQECI